MAAKKVKKGNVKKAGNTADAEVDGPKKVKKVLKKTKTESGESKPTVASPKAKPKPAKGEAVDKEKEAAKEQAATQAIAEIKAGLKEYNSGKGGEYVLRGWSNKYRFLLGSYKKFLTEHPEHFAVKEDARGVFTVGFANNPPPSPVLRAGKKGEESWPQLCERAWDQYCHQVLKEKRAEMPFVSGFPKAAREALVASPAGAAEVDIVKATRTALAKTEAAAGDTSSTKRKAKAKLKAKQ
mmetsp:Transcript_22831/g.52244  ORF Transcript_22831/g.52244 Transcript_22831/m.52244 type:complete len:239 (+) Transcript_22831:40-756(+)